MHGHKRDQCVSSILNAKSVLFKSTPLLLLTEYSSPNHTVRSYNLPHCLLLANAPETDKKDLLSELELMKTLKPHDHVIKLLGCVTESGKQFYPT